MTVLIDNRTENEMDTDIESTIKDVIKESLKYESFDDNCEVSISFVTNDEIHSINKQFRNIDRETDVLSFPQLTFEENEEISKNENGEIILGDIIISVEKALAQSEEYGHSFKREMAFLTAHSMLHLLGYDHMTPEEEKDMFKRQEDILNILGIKR
jgi:probable rRNA maturation factor